MSPPDLVRHVGIKPENGEVTAVDRDALHRIIAVKLAAQGFDVPIENQEGDGNILNLAPDLFRVYCDRSCLLESHRCPIDQRIQAFVDDALKTTGETVQLPSDSVTVDRYGLLRKLSFLQAGDEFDHSEISSYCLPKNAVLHNPLNDKRTKKGSLPRHRLRSSHSRGQDRGAAPRRLRPSPRSGLQASW